MVANHFDTEESFLESKRRHMQHHSTFMCHLLQTIIIHLCGSIVGGSQMNADYLTLTGQLIHIYIYIIIFLCEGMNECQNMHMPISLIYIFGKIVHCLWIWIQCPHFTKTSKCTCYDYNSKFCLILLIYTDLTLTVLVTTIDVQWEGMGDVGSAKYEPALLPPCTTIRVLSYSN